MRHFSLLICLLIITCTYPAIAAKGSPTPLPDHVTLTWTGDPATTMTISWRTDTSVKLGVVQYHKGKTSESATQQVTASSVDLLTELGTFRRFSATLTGLTPHTTYTYQIGNGTIWSYARTFTTADPQARAFTFLVFGDSQSVPPYTQWRTTVQNAYKAHPEAKFLVNVGDLVDTGQSGAHWHAWFDAAAGVIDTIPIVPVLGNHETYSARGLTRPTYWNALFSLPKNRPAGLKNQAYAFDYGIAHFVVLDSQQGEQRKHGDILTPQKKWLDADLAATRATWKMAFFHKGPYGVRPGNPNAEVKAAFCPVLETRRVDLVFNGHDHGIARTYPIKNGARVKAPSQGAIYYTTGRSGIKTYRNIARQPLHSFFYNPLDQPNYLVVTVTETRLAVTAKKQNGVVIDRLVIDKAADCLL